MKKFIDPPINGWKTRSWYLVDVAFNADNVIHRAMLFTGFLNDGDNIPGSYNCLVSVQGSYEEKMDFRNAFYLRSIRLLFSEDELNSGLTTNTPRILRKES